MTEMLERSDLERFRSIVADRLGLLFDDDKLEILAEALRPQIEERKRESLVQYLQRISDGNPEELRKIAERLTVCETYFFRYTDQFRALAESILPDRIRTRNHERQLRILSAGCSSGEEAYSVAILLRDQFPDLASWKIKIQAIDVNAAMLKKAVRGQYAAWALRETPDDLKRKYFRADGRDFSLDSTLKSSVVFEESNLAMDDRRFWTTNTFDIVLCRNVIMYFTAEAARSLMARIARSLVPGGYLFLGHAETLRGISQDFHLLHTHDTFYYRRRETPENLGEDLLPDAARSGTFAPDSAIKGADSIGSWFDIIQQTSQRITTLTSEHHRPNGSACATPRNTSPASRVAGNQTLAVELMRKEKFLEAIELLRAEPNIDADSQLVLGVLLANNGDLAEAEETARHLLQVNEMNAGAHYLMALCLDRTGDLDAAMEHDEAAIYLDSTFAMPHLHMGLIAKRSGAIATAKREFGHALATLAREDSSRILLFGGGFSREALVDLCRTQLALSGGAQ